MRICITCDHDIYDKKEWSGTIAALTDQFERRGHILEGFAIKGKFKYFFIRIFRRLYRFLFFLDGNCRSDEFSYFRHNAARFRYYLRNYQDDALLFTGEHCLDHPLPWNMKSYAYIDRALGPLIRMKADCQPGVERYLRKYEKNDKLSLSCLNACFTANEWSRKYIIDNYGLPKEKIINVGIGINVPLYLGEKDYSNPDILIVLRKGTEKYKGLDLLLEAFKLAQKRMPDLTLHVVGTDYEKVSGVKYYYNRPRSVTIDLFKKCSLYAMPAILEPMGITYLEALANKTPILGLNRFAFPELCGYGKYGFIVPVATPESVSEQIVKAFSNPNKLEKMGLEGQQMVMKRYSWSKVADKMLKTMMEDMVEV